MKPYLRLHVAKYTLSLGYAVKLTFGKQKVLKKHWNLERSCTFATQENIGKGFDGLGRCRGARLGWEFRFNSHIIHAFLFLHINCNYESCFRYGHLRAAVSAKVKVGEKLPFIHFDTLKKVRLMLPY